MKALVQRVTEGSVTVDGQVIGAIGKGLVILFGADMKVKIFNDGPVTFMLESRGGVGV